MTHFVLVAGDQEAHGPRDDPAKDRRRRLPEEGGGRRGPDAGLGERHDLQPTRPPHSSGKTPLFNAVYLCLVLLVFKDGCLVPYW